ncbi:nicotinate phosphoribosyltransferase [Haladaptatus cibarius]|uniref:nicotinate phosphoribosyltransferase n=1 Tax=Haladaptatus cibarius TaxID=453847 RepID=UPI000678D19F|nr:nicotinate phosphoribosyltransferase [Haladaptatus cibarius]
MVGSEQKNGEPNFGYVTPENLGLFTDLYELTMLQGYHGANHNPMATFSLFFRELPTDRGYVLTAGLEQVIASIETLSFGEEALSYLEKRGFESDFLDTLANFEFTGGLRALPEGTPVFPNEPILEVTAPIFEAQLLETLLLNQVGFESLVATKAARMREAVDRHGNDQSLVDFGSRRAHGTDAGMKAARAAVIGGFDGTSLVSAGEAFDIPVHGTMAHSWVQSFEDERESFSTFTEQYGDDSILLVDTYDTVEGARIAMDVADEHDAEVGVRLDSGDLATLSKEVAEIVGDAPIFVSSGMDEYKIADFLERGGVATGFGPGTALTTSEDAPSLDLVYKLTEIERDGEMVPSMKLSSGKVTYPGAKSLRRVHHGEEDEYRKDILALRGEVVGSEDEDVRDGSEGDSGGEEQLVTVFENGTRVYDSPGLDAIADRAREGRRNLPAECRSLRNPAEYPVEISEGLRELTNEVQTQLEARNQ